MALDSGNDGIQVSKMQMTVNPQILVHPCRLVPLSRSLMG